MRPSHSAARMLALASLLLDLLAGACDLGLPDQIKAYPNDLSDFLERGEYAMDPTTILAALDSGTTDIFNPVLATPGVYPTPYPAGSFAWRQSDFLKVAAAVHQYVWNEDLHDWLVYSLHFFRGCADDPIGFDSGDVTYFQAVNGSRTYLAREIDVYPVAAGVSWGGGTAFPRPVFGWKSIDLGKLRVTADDALQVAEGNGGKIARQRVQNKCTTDVFLKPNGDISDWIVLYDSAGSIILEARVNPYTGQFKTVPGT